MYYPNCLEYENNIEEICYDQDHIDKVWDEIKQIIPEYFQKFTDTESGHSVQESELIWFNFKTKKQTKKYKNNP